MKNIHLLPTEKPSRLGYLTKKGKEVFKDLRLFNKPMPNILDSENQHIYITNSEDIKEGDWFINKFYIDKRAPIASQRFAMNSNAVFSNPKKIILTTDQDLIADGVQAIDDEFLEWFVKNPSCEEVEVQKWFDGLDFLEYKIIIPQEEPKEEKWDKLNKELDDALDAEFGSEEPKQETLEEAIKREYEARKFNSDFPFDPQSFKLGAKWQSERMYSEEEVKNIAVDFFYYWWNAKGNNTEEGFDKWFEQFKKKELTFKSE
jgi:hypothetical protein